MKFLCGCGKVISDQTDYLPHKAHFIGDEDWFAFLNAIDDAIEKSGPAPDDKQAAVTSVRALVRKIAQTIYQCPSCGELSVSEGKASHEFRPVNPASPKNLLRGLQNVRG
jgi:hypothetical protein